LDEYNSADGKAEHNNHALVVFHEGSELVGHTFFFTVVIHISKIVED
jgi:hypothetical protein